MGNKRKSYPLASQRAALRKSYPEGKFIWHTDNEFSWTCSIKPTEYSDLYKLKIVYKKGRRPETYVITPKPLLLADGAKRLPHVYSQEKQELCLYHKSFEWCPFMLISDTIVHWAIQWLYYYEIWRFTGLWEGGGHGCYDIKPNE